MREVKLPKLGAQIENAEITEWVAAEGEKVNERQVIAILETEKSSYDLETEFSGILHIVKDVSDDKIDAGVLIAVIAECLNRMRSRAMISLERILFVKELELLNNCCMRVLLRKKSCHINRLFFLYYRFQR